MSQMKDTLGHVQQAMAEIDELWKSTPAARTKRLADIVSLLDRARAKLVIELRGRPCTDEEAKAAVEEFFNRKRG